MKKTLVLGASNNPMRFSYKMVKSLLRHGYKVVAIGLREGEINGVKIHTGKPAFKMIHTVSLFIGPDRQPMYYDYLIALKPMRVIFNPGTVNRELIAKLNNKGIETVIDCALIMVSSGNY